MTIHFLTILIGLIFTSIDKVANEGLDVYRKFHSHQWGDFKTYFKFQINAEGRSKIEIGQAKY